MSSSESPTTSLWTTRMPSLFSPSVRKSEFVSSRYGVSNSDPMAMISAFIHNCCTRWRTPRARRSQNSSNEERRNSAVEGKALNIPIEGEEGVIGGDHGAMGEQKRQPYDVAPAEHELGLRLRREPHNATFAAERCRDVQVSAAVESESLRAAQSAKKNTHLTGGRDSIDAVEARSRRARDEKFAGGAESKMVRGHGRLERGEDENLAFGRDLENCSAAIADIETSSLVERDSRGDAHAFDPLHRASVGRNAVNRAVLAAGDE